MNLFSILLLLALALPTNAVNRIQEASTEIKFFTTSPIIREDGSGYLWVLHSTENYGIIYGDRVIELGHRVEQRQTRAGLAESTGTLDLILLKSADNIEMLKELQKNGVPENQMVTFTGISTQTNFPLMALFDGQPINTNFQTALYLRFDEAKIALEPMTKPMADPTPYTLIKKDCVSYLSLIIGEQSIGERPDPTRWRRGELPWPEFQIINIPPPPKIEIRSHRMTPPNTKPTGPTK